MAIVIMQRWDGFTADKYNALRDVVRWDVEPPAGMLVHIACYEGDILRMADVWESQELFDDFFGTRIAPGLAKLGIEDVPQVIVAPVHEVVTASIAG